MKNNDKNYCTLYIVRHGETEWNIARIVQGHKDSKLTEKGEEQAKLLRKKFQNITFDAVYSSDLLRAKRTAEIIALESTLAVQTTHMLRERYFGKFEGIKIAEMEETTKELFATYQTLSDKEKFHFQFPDTENDEKMVSRFITFLREVAVTNSGKKILVVSHSGIMRAFLVHVGFATYTSLRHGAISNTAYIKLESDGVDFFVKETEGIILQK